MSAVMMKGMFRKVFGVALGGLAYHLETGERVTARAASSRLQHHRDRSTGEDACSTPRGSRFPWHGACVGFDSNGVSQREGRGAHRPWG